MSRGLVVLAAGGTGGHLFPAEALASVLGRLGIEVALVTDSRVDRLAETFPAARVHQVVSGTPSGGSPLAKARALGRLGRGVAAAGALLARWRPACAVGFGGYPTVPPILAASILRVPTLIHEQNGVIGRANRFLMGRASAVATGFADVRGLPVALAGKTYRTGNPIRPAVVAASATPYAEPMQGGRLDLLVFGGSQGARVMSDVVPPALASLPPAARARLAVAQQARPEDADAVRSAYAAAGIAAEVQPFFADMPRRIADAHLVVSRAGASTVAELAAIGRPSILVPLPGALDQDQAANAATLDVIGAAAMIPQSQFTPARLAAEIAARLADPAALTRAAAAAKGAGVLDAAERLASVVLALAKISVPDHQPEGRAP